MPLDKPIKINDQGANAEFAPATSSAGAADAGRVIALGPDGKIDPTMISGGTTVALPATETISGGSWVNLWSNAGVASVRNADNTSIAKRAHGYAPAAIASGATGTVQLGRGINAALSGLTPGATYFLGTAGGQSTAIPTASGSIVQQLGVARSATELSFVEQPPVIRA